MKTVFLAGLLAVFFRLLWPLCAQLALQNDTLRDARVLFLIAHPDDEAMFFSPTVLSLARPELNNRLALLCLSVGNAEGLGQVREQELYHSGQLLGFDLVHALDDVRFNDSMSAEWPVDQIANVLDGFNRLHNGSRFDTLVTFDHAGVSGHPNHRSLYHGALRYQAQRRAADGGEDVPIYALTSHPIWKKYAGIFDIPVATLSHRLSPPAAASPARPSSIVSVSSPAQYGSGVRAMVEGHVSQMRWFRWGWIRLSRYMYVNDIRLVKGSDDPDQSKQSHLEL